MEKVGDDLWRFNARMVHDRTDVTLPIVVPMKWVDDTPVVTLTDYSIPTLGKFSARVFFYSDRYAGTWQHGTKSGGTCTGGSSVVRHLSVGLGGHHHRGQRARVFRGCPTR